MTDTTHTEDVIKLGHGTKADAGSHVSDFDLIRRYWHSMRKGADVPRRSDIDPRGIQPLLANALIIERIAPGLARLRIAGQHLSDLMGMEVRSMPVSAFVAPEDRDQMAQALTELFERPAIVTLDMTAPGALRQPKIVGRMILMPLRSDLGDISRALGCFVTKGPIGRVPRRFQITSSHVEHVKTPEQAVGFAEAAPAFAHDELKLQSERSYLRLVKSD